MKEATVFSRFLPVRPLRSQIAYYWTVNLPMPRTDDRLELSLPDLYGEIVFNLSGPYLRKNICTADVAFVKGSNIVGLRTHTTGSMRRERSGPLDLVGVKLFPWALSCWTAISTVELTNEVVNVSDLARSGLADLESRLRETGDSRQRIQLLDDYFLPRVRQLSEQERWLQSLLKHWRMRPELKVSELASAFDVSSKTLERRFQSLLGTTPKTIQRVLRFNDWLASVTRTGSTLSAGGSGSFYDQSHLIRECRHFLAATPRQICLDESPYTLNTFVA